MLDIGDPVIACMALSVFPSGHQNVRKVVDGAENGPKSACPSNPHLTDMRIRSFHVWVANRGSRRLPPGCLLVGRDVHAAAGPTTVSTPCSPPSAVTRSVRAVM